MIAGLLQGAQPQPAFFQGHQGLAGRQVNTPGMQRIAILGRQQQAGLRAEQLAQARLVQQVTIAQQQHDDQIGRAGDRVEQFGQAGGIQAIGTHTENE